MSIVKIRQVIALPATPEANTLYFVRAADSTLLETVLVGSDPAEIRHLINKADVQALIAAAGGGSAAWGSIAGTLAEQIDLQAALDAKVEAYPPVTITTSITLNAAEHSNRLLIVDSATPVTLTIPDDATGGFGPDDSINAFQQGTGSVSLSGANLLTVTGTVSATAARYRFVGAVHTASADAWAPTELSASASGASSSVPLFDSGVSALFVPARAGNTQMSLSGSLNGSAQNGSTIVARGSSNASILTRRPRVGIVGSSAAVDISAGVGMDSVWCDTESYKLDVMFSPADAIASGTKSFVGLVQSLGGQDFLVTPGWEPTDNNGFGKVRVGVACASTESEFVFVVRGVGGTTKVFPINGGVGFPANGNLTNLYRLQMEYFPEGTAPRKFVLTFTNVTSKLSATRQFDIAADLPATTEGLFTWCRRSSGPSNAAQPMLDFYGLGIGKFA